MGEEVGGRRWIAFRDDGSLTRNSIIQKKHIQKTQPNFKKPKYTFKEDIDRKSKNLIIRPHFLIFTAKERIYFFPPFEAGKCLPAL